MKNFLSVLYRRILYKIPLKLLLVLLVIFGLLFACTKAELVLVSTASNGNLGGSDYVQNRASVIIDSSIGLKCSYTSDNNCYYYDSDDNYTQTQMAPNVIYCFDDNYDLSCGTRNLVYFLDFYENNINYPKYTISQCQSEYNLIPINEVDSSYCQSNNLCSSGGTPSNCPNVGVSNLFINDIFHPGAFNIIMNIPEEIDRDYAYTNSGQNMNIDVVGYNVDYDYINDVVDTQNYKPTSDDLSSIVSSIIPLFVPGLCIILLLYFIFRFIKKIF